MEDVKGGVSADVYGPIICACDTCTAWAAADDATAGELTWIVAVSPSSRMISPIRESLPTRTSSYIALPDMWSATTTGPETLRMYLQVHRGYP